jgi:hypothetical protein
MNDSPASPRLLCRFVRRWTSDGSTHVASCPDCQQYFDQCDELESSLRRDAARANPAAPVALERGILLALRHAQIEQRPAFQAWRYVWMGATAALVNAISLLVSRPSGKRNVVVAENQADAAALIDATQSFSARLLNEWVPTAAEAVQDNALQRELDAVYIDARSAIGFLKLNFLVTNTPENTATKTRAEG